MSNRYVPGRVTVGDKEYHAVIDTERQRYARWGAVPSNRSRHLVCEAARMLNRGQWSSFDYTWTRGLGDTP